MTAIDTIKVLDQLEQLVEDSKRFMGFVRLDEDEFFMLVSKIRASLPEDVRRASKIAESTDRILEDAQMAAEKAVASSHDEAQRMLAEAQAEAAHIAEAARSEAARAIESARYEASQLLDGATAQAAQIDNSVRGEADRLISEAREKSQTLTDQSEIARIAAAQARQMVEEAEERGRAIVSRAETDAIAIRSGADDYARDVLYTLEHHLTEAIGQFDDRFGNVLSTVQRGRRALEQNDAASARATVGRVESPPPPVGTTARRAGGRR